MVRVSNLVFNLEQLVRQGPQPEWQGLAKLIDANAVNGYPNFAADNLSRVQSVDPNAPHQGEARIIYKPAIQVWHRALVYHYLVTIVSFMAVCALNVLGNYSAHAQEVVLPLTRAVTSIGLLFTLVEHWCFLGNMRPQVSAFYRLLAWEILSENLVVLQLFGEPSPVFAVCQDDRNPYQGYQHHHNSVTRVRRHYLAMATHAEALSTMGAATSSYGTAVCGITTAIFGALLGTVLPPASTVASDIVTGMVFSILLGAELEVLKGIVSWSRASNLYVKCAWIVDLANGFLRASDISTFLSEVLLPRANVWNAFTVNHNNFAALPELSVDFTLAAAVVAPAQDLNGEVAQAGAGAPAG